MTKRATPRAPKRIMLSTAFTHLLDDYLNRRHWLHRFANIEQWEEGLGDVQQLCDRVGRDNPRTPDLSKRMQIALREALIHVDPEWVYDHGPWLGAYNDNHSLKEIRKLVRYARSMAVVNQRSWGMAAE